MRERQIIKLTELLHSDYKLVADNVMLSCPNARFSNVHKGLDRSPSFGISISNLKSQCNCFACGLGGDLTYVATKLFNEEKIPQEAYDFIILAEQGDISTIMASLSVEVKDKHKRFPDYYAFTKDRQGDAYLKSRGVSDGEIQRFRLGFDVDRQMVIFPLVSFYTEEIVCAFGRTITEPKGCHFYPSKDSSVFFGEHLVDPSRHEIVLVEGQIDVIAFSRLYSNVVCLGGLKLPEKQLERVLGFAEVVTLAFDNDMAGWEGVSRIGQKLAKRTRVFVVTLPDDKDPDSSSREELEAAYKTKKIF